MTFKERLQVEVMVQTFMSAELVRWQQGAWPGNDVLVAIKSCDPIYI